MLKYCFTGIVGLVIQHNNGKNLDHTLSTINAEYETESNTPEEASSFNITEHLQKITPNHKVFLDMIGNKYEFMFITGAFDDNGFIFNFDAQLNVNDRFKSLEKFLLEVCTSTYTFDDLIIFSCNIIFF